MSSSQGFPDNSARNNAKLLDDLGISQDGDNSLSDDLPMSLQSHESMFHQSLLKSMEELLASEAAMEAEASNNQQQQQQGAMPMMDNRHVFPASLMGSMAEQHHQQQQHHHQPLSALAANLPIKTLEMLAASHLQLLAQQQASMSPSASETFSLLNAQPAGLTNDGSMMFVTPQHFTHVPMQQGWVGHRVVALPSNFSSTSMSPHHLTHAQSSGSTGTHAQAQHYQQHMGIRSEDVLRHAAGSSRGAGGQGSSASWDHQSASSVPSLQAAMTSGGSSSTCLRSSGSNDGLDRLDFRSMSNFPTVAQRGRGRVYGYGPKSIRQRVPTALPTLIEPTWSGSAGAGAGGAGGGGGGGAAVRATAPSWAGADWDPLRTAQSRPKKTSGAGTGVFLPSGTGVFLPLSEDLPPRSELLGMDEQPPLWQQEGGGARSRRLLQPRQRGETGRRRALARGRRLKTCQRPSCPDPPGGGKALRCSGGGVPVQVGGRVSGPAAPLHAG